MSPWSDPAIEGTVVKVTVAGVSEGLAPYEL